MEWVVVGDDGWFCSFDGSRPREESPRIGLPREKMSRLTWKSLSCQCKNSGRPADADLSDAILKAIGKRLDLATASSQRRRGCYSFTCQAMTISLAQLRFPRRSRSPFFCLEQLSLRFFHLTLVYTSSTLIPSLFESPSDSSFDCIWVACQPSSHL